MRLSPFNGVSRLHGGGGPPRTPTDKRARTTCKNTPCNSSGADWGAQAKRVPPSSRRCFVMAGRPGKGSWPGVQRPFPDFMLQFTAGLLAGRAGSRGAATPRPSFHRFHRMRSCCQTKFALSGDTVGRCFRRFPWLLCCWPVDPSAGLRAKVALQLQLII